MFWWSNTLSGGSLLLKMERAIWEQFMKMDNLLKIPHVRLSAHSHLPTLSHRTKFSPLKGKAEGGRTSTQKCIWRPGKWGIRLLGKQRRAQSLRPVTSACPSTLSKFWSIYWFLQIVSELPLHGVHPLSLDPQAMHFYVWVNPLSSNTRFLCDTLLPSAHTDQVRFSDTSSHRLAVRWPCYFCCSLCLSGWRLRFHRIDFALSVTYWGNSDLSDMQMTM